MTIRAKVILDVKDIADAQLALPQVRRSWNFLTVVTFFFALWLVDRVGAPVGVPLAVALATAVYFLRVPIQRRAAAHNLLGRTEEEKQVQFEFDDTGYRCDGPLGSGSARWESLHGWVESPRTFALRPSQTLILVVPKAALASDEVGALRVLLQSRVRTREVRTRSWRWLVGLWAVLIVLFFVFYSIFSRRPDGAPRSAAVIGESPEARFWAWFEANDQALFAVKTGTEPICDELAEKLHAVRGGLTFEFGPIQSGKRDFVVSADGIKQAFPAVLAVTRAAPPMKRWKVIAFRPGRPDVTQVSVDGVELDAHDVQFLATRGERPDLIITVPGYRKTPAQTYEKALYLLLDGMVGEYAVEMAIGGIDIRDPKGRPSGKWLPLTRLGEVVKPTP